MTEIEQAEATGGPESGLHLLFIDGGKKANAPGQDAAVGAIAAILKDPDGKKILAESSGVIDAVPDPHVAEYRALMAGLELAKANGIEYLVVFSDSRTVVNQVNRIVAARRPPSRHSSCRGYRAPNDFPPRWSPDLLGSPGVEQGSRRACSGRTSR